MNKSMPKNIEIQSVSNQSSQGKSKKKKDLGNGLIMSDALHHSKQKKSKNWKQSINYIASEKKQKQMKSIKRVKQPQWIYFLTLICTLLTGTENIYIFLTQTTELYVYLFVPTVILRMALSVFFSYFLCNNWKLLLKLYLTIDKVFLTEVVEIVSVICYVSIFMPYTDIDWFYYFYEFTYPVMLFTSIGYFRVMLVFCNWKPWQVITYKISLMIGAISFFSIGIYYTVAAADFTNGQNPEIDKLIKNIIFLYIFAGFELFNQLFAKIDDVDGTATFKGGYKLECDPQDMQILLNGPKNQDQMQKQPLNESKSPDFKAKRSLSNDKFEIKRINSLDIQ